MKKIMIVILLLTWWPALSYAGMSLKRIKEVSPNFLTEVNGVLFFAAYDSVNGYSLWKSDGTRGGTEIVKSFNTGAENHAMPTGLLNANGTLYFCAFETDIGWELWKSNGSESGTTMVTDLNPGTEDGVSDVYCHLAYLDNKVFFPGIDDMVDGDGAALFKTDGTAANTEMVYDLQPSNVWGIPQNLFVMNNTLFFIGNDAEHGDEWWKCEGPDYNTASMVKDINTNFKFGGVNSNKPVVMDSYFYFAGNDGTDGYELWRSNGNDADTEMVKNINPSGPSTPADFTVADGTLYFFADDGTDGRELWKSDGTDGGTEMVKNINTDPGSGSDPDWLTAIGTNLYLSADDGTHGREVWKSDGTDNGTVMIKDIDPLGEGSPRRFTQYGDEVYFRADDGKNGDELWKTNGVVGNASMVANIGAGSDSSWPGDFFVFNNALFFSATYDSSVDEGEGDALFRYGEQTDKLYWPMILPSLINNAKK